MNQSTAPFQNRPHRTATGQIRFVKWGVVAGTLLAMVIVTGCARPSSSKWAQTSPIMTADTTTDTTVNLGLRD